MGVHVLTGDRDRAVLYCSTTDWAFGPVWQSAEEAEAFLRWLKPYDPRLMTEDELRASVSQFLHTPAQSCHTCGASYRPRRTQIRPPEFCSDECWDRDIDARYVVGAVGHDMPHRPEAA